MAPNGKGGACILYAQHGLDQTTKARLELPGVSTLFSDNLKSSTPVWLTTDNLGFLRERISIRLFSNLAGILLVPFKSSEDPASSFLILFYRELVWEPQTAVSSWNSHTPSLEKLFQAGQEITPSFKGENYAVKDLRQPPSTSELAESISEIFTNWSIDLTQFTRVFFLLLHTAQIQRDIQKKDTAYTREDILSEIQKLCNKMVRGKGTFYSCKKGYSILIYCTNASLNPRLFSRQLLGTIHSAFSLDGDYSDWLSALHSTATSSVNPEKAALNLKAE